MDRLDDMLAFIRVVDTRSFTAAAEKLGLSKSAVSRRMTDLENRLGARLLNRTTRSLSITEVGQAFYERCSRIVADVEEAERAVADLYAEPRGTLKINAPDVVRHDPPRPRHRRVPAPPSRPGNRHGPERPLRGPDRGRLRRGGADRAAPRQQPRGAPSGAQPHASSSAAPPTSRPMAARRTRTIWPGTTACSTPTPRRRINGTSRSRASPARSRFPAPSGSTTAKSCAKPPSPARASRCCPHSCSASRSRAASLMWR